MLTGNCYEDLLKFGVLYNSVVRKKREMNVKQILILHVRKSHSVLQAGIKKESLQISLEPEVAALCCRLMPSESESLNPSFSGLGKDDVYMLNGRGLKV